MPSADPGAPRQPWPLRLGRTQQGDTLRLGLRNLYILPTGFGWSWLAGAVLLQVVGIQTQRNGPLLLSFLLLALMLLALHLTHFNLHGLEMRCEEARTGFADEPLLYPLLLRSRCPREAIRLQLEQGAPIEPQSLGAGCCLLGLPWRCNHRGQQQPGVVLIHTTAPLGLFVCWSRWRPPTPQVVIPARRSGPIGLVPPEPHPVAQGQQALERRDGSEHWHDLRPQRPQDSQTRLAWKALAQGRGRLSKVFRDTDGSPPLLAPAAGVPHEQALEHLSEAVWRLSERGEPFGLQLPGGSIAPAQGREHRDRCLLALALAP
jgi:uncharacterized protein (DUF58 family)